MFSLRDDYSDSCKQLHDPHSRSIQGNWGGWETKDLEGRITDNQISFWVRLDKKFPFSILSQSFSTPMSHQRKISSIL
jgi:hypothetical protein